MRPTVENNFYRDDLDGDTFEFSLQSDPLIMKRLSDDVYQRPIEAIIRELGTNAYDAHIDAGKKEKPFDVFLPTEKSAEFRIRDYGLGISRDQLIKLYTRYAASTRRSSDDHVGSIGIGSKSPFAYTNQFTVISRHKSNKVTALCYKDSRHMPMMKIIQEEATSEPSGLEVFFPVDSSAQTKFESYAKTVYQWFDTRPNVSPKLDYSNEVRESIWFEYDNWALAKPSNDNYFRDNNYSTIIMGGVAYKTLFRSPYSNLILFANIGDVDINMSRESIQNNNNNARWHNLQLQNIDKNIDAAIKQNSGNVTLRYEAARLLHKMRATFGAKKVRGIELNGSTLFEHRLPLYDARKAKDNSYICVVSAGGKKRRNFQDRVSPDMFDEPILYEDAKTRCVVGAGQYAQNHKTRQVNLINITPEQFEKFTDYPAKKVLPATRFYVAPPKTSRSTAYGAADVVEYATRTGSHYALPQYWTTISHDPTAAVLPTDIYAPIAYHRIESKHEIDVYGLSDILDFSKHRLFGVKNRSLDRFKKSGMQSLDDYIDGLTYTQQDVDYTISEAYVKKLIDKGFHHKLYSLSRSKKSIPNSVLNVLAPNLESILTSHETRAHSTVSNVTRYNLVSGKLLATEKHKIDAAATKMVKDLYPICDESSPAANLLSEACQFVESEAQRSSYNQSPSFVKTYFWRGFEQQMTKELQTAGTNP